MASAPAGGGLTSTTAPGKIFASRSDLALHYKSDWHRYNLKRREAGLPMIAERDFNARLEAALAARKEREERERGAGRGHLKDKSGKGKKRGKGGGKKEGEKPPSGREDNDRCVNEEGEATTAAGFGPMEASEERPAGGETEGEVAEEEEEPEEEEPPNIDPLESLFESTTFPTLELNLDHMSKTYGFFVPDSEYLCDLEGLLGYCHEKVKLGHTCLYCQRVFRTWEGCRRHMVDSRHAKLRYERGIDLEEFDVFYDFSEADAEFLTEAPRRREKVKKKADGEEEAEEVDYMDDDNDVDSAEWEDISDAEDTEMNDDDEGVEDEDLYRGYEEELATHGFDVTPLGELVFPDGRIVGHRGLSRYYKQSVRGPSERAAVVAARRANGERIWAGRVFDTRSGQQDCKDSSLALMRAGLDPAAARARGRAADGILVNAKEGGGFTQLSLYRYRAAVRKSRRDEDKGRRLKQRNLGMNINRMDKKANRLMNGVSVAHAAR